MKQDLFWVILGPYEKHLGEFFLKLGQGFRMGRCLKSFLFYLWWPFCSVEQNHLSNFGRGLYEEHLCEHILNFDQ